MLVGVSEYQYLPKNLWLDSCDKDTEALAAFLRSPRGGATPPDHLKLLLNAEATARNVRLALDEVITHSKPGDVIVLFYAGHGKVVPYGSSEAAYLMAYDSEPEHLNATAIPMDELHRYVDNNMRAASQVFLITDACHAGAIMPNSPYETSWKTRGISDYIQELGERNGVLNLMACRRDEVAYEDSRLGGHGVLTYALLRALEGEGSSTAAGLVRVQDVLEEVTSQVPRLTNQKQHPRHSSNYTDEFPLADLSKPGPKLSLPEPPGNRLEAETRSVFDRNRRLPTLRVVGAERMSEVYLVKGDEQRTVGRPLSATNVLVVDDLEPGDYQLVQLGEDGREARWRLTIGDQDISFDLRTESRI